MYLQTTSKPHEKTITETAILANINNGPSTQTSGHVRKKIVFTDNVYQVPVLWDRLQLVSIRSPVPLKEIQVESGGYLIHRIPLAFTDKLTNHVQPENGPFVYRFPFPVFIPLGYKHMCGIRSSLTIVPEDETQKNVHATGFILGDLFVRVVRERAYVRDQQITIVQSCELANIHIGKNIFRFWIGGYTNGLFLDNISDISDIQKIEYIADGYCVFEWDQDMIDEFGVTIGEHTLYIPFSSFDLDLDLMTTKREGVELYKWIEQRLVLECQTEMPNLTLRSAINTKFCDFLRGTRMADIGWNNKYNSHRHVESTEDV